MSGETEASVSGWTTDTLHQHLAQQIASLDRVLSRRMDDAGKAIEAALASAEKAVAKAEAASERRFEAVNEFRQALSDQTATFIPRAEYDTAHEALAQRVTATAAQLAALELRLTSRLDQGEGTDRGVASYRTERRLDTGVVLTAASVLTGFLILAVALYAALHH